MTETTINDIIEIVTFLSSVITLWKQIELKKYDPENLFYDTEQGFDAGENFLINMIWQIRTNQFRYDFNLAMVAFLTWFKLFIYFRASLTFGPMFKIMQ
jgi:hypothetical protein